MAMFFLTGGIEYSVIFPTMYNYVQDLGGEEWLYGLSLSAFSISNLITSPLYGIVFDKTKQTRWIVIVGNLFEIGGKQNSTRVIIVMYVEMVVVYLWKFPLFNTLSVNVLSSMQGI